MRTITSTKPLDADEVEHAVVRALHILEMDRQIPEPAAAREIPGGDVIIGKGRQMKEVFKMIGVLCRSRATALIQGETGTGKELIARVIHRSSPFNAEPMVTVDCSAVVETLLESQLFGHQKGSFTGATHTQPGRIEQAGRGTLFLDEIGELPLSLQGKFLGFLERREFTRIGGQQTLRSRCRIIAATNRDLSAMVAQGTFRKDLYYRLKVVTVHVPPLRERIGDLPDLAHYFLKKANGELDTAVEKFQPGVIERLMQHPWKGNVRELENVIVAAMVNVRGKVILMEDIASVLSSHPSGDADAFSLFSLAHVEREHIRKILCLTRWNRTRSARLLGITLPTLRSKIRKYNLDPPDGPVHPA